jgi:fatty acid desaturase
VGALIISAVMTVLLMAGIYWLSHVFLRRIGIKTRGELAPATRRVLWLCSGGGLVIAAFATWAFGTHHAAVGVAALVAFLVLPEFVLIPLRVSRSRRAAELSRERRTGSDPRST